MRPIYETDANRLAENEFLMKLAAPLGCNRVVRVTKRLYPVDALGYVGNRVHAFIEAKIRTNTVEAYATYMLSLEKFSKGAWLADCCNSEYVVAVQWANAFGCWRRSDPRINQPVIAMGGRTDRGDADDIEPVVHLPIEEFNVYRL